MLEIKTPEHPVRALIKKQGIPMIKVSTYLGLSYAHACHVLIGHYKPSGQVKQRLDKLHKYLLKKEVATNEKQ